MSSRSWTGAFERDITDQATVYVSVTRGGQTKTVENYGDAGPDELWAIEQLADAIVSSASKWEKQ